MDFKINSGIIVVDKQKLQETDKKILTDEMIEHIIGYETDLIPENALKDLKIELRGDEFVGFVELLDNIKLSFIKFENREQDKEILEYIRSYII